MTQDTTNDVTDHTLRDVSAKVLPILEPGGPVRADLVRARTTIWRAVAGADADLPTAAAMIDRAIKALCFHDPATWQTAGYPAGEPLTTCPGCGVSWYEHGDDRAVRLEVTRVADATQDAAYMAALGERLADRAHEHGHAYVTPKEGAWLAAHDRRQPGHTRYRYSTPDEDLSDAAQGED